MAEKYMPFDYDETAPDPAVYEYTATDERTFNMSNFTNGVFPQTKLVESGNIVTASYLGGSLAVTAGSGLSVDVSAGIAMVEGVKYWNAEAKNITFEKNNVEQVFDIVVELDTNNQCVLTKKKARTSGIEITADLIRTDDIYQLAIATVTIPANATQITAAMITDQRLNTNLCTDNKPVCGLVGAVSQIDFSVLYNQIMDWFNNLKGKLSSDAAVNLQTQVDALKGSFSHLLSGTVHALTGTFPVSSGICTIKFKATAGYTSGDTFAVNGTAYTAAMQGGESLDTDAFITGDVVQIGVDIDAHKLVFKRGGVTLTGDAAVGDVIGGKTFYNTDPKALLTGALTLTGTATSAYVASRLTFYNTDAKTKLTGTGAAVKRYTTGNVTSSGAVEYVGVWTASTQSIEEGVWVYPIYLNLSFTPRVVILVNHSDSRRNTIYVSSGLSNFYNYNTTMLFVGNARYINSSSTKIYTMNGSTQFTFYAWE